MIRLIASLLLISFLVFACKTSQSTIVAEQKHQIQSLQQSIPGTPINFDMTLVPGGSFQMGSPDTEPNRRSDEGPQFAVKVDSFWMGTYELGFEEYDIFRNKDKDMPIAENPDWNGDAIARPSPPYEDPTFGMGKDSVPAVSMTQFAALQYCKWLSDKSGIFYRLPSEAEWEYACKANEDYAADQTLVDDFAWHYDNSSEKYHKKGQKKPNAFGLYDMLGNVSEWTLDQYTEDAYVTLSAVAMTETNPWLKPTRLHPRTVRGASWDDDKEKSRCACRIKSSPRWKERDPQIPKSFWWNTDSPFVGFRLVRPIPQPSKEEQAAFWELVLGDS